MQIAVVVLIVLIFLTIFLVASSVFIVKQQQNFIIERFGKFHKIVEAGIHLKIPIMDKISHKIDIREVAIDYPPQGVITEDNVTMRVDTVIYYKVSDPLKLAYTIQNPTQAIENLTATALRNVFGELALDKTLNSRDYINQQMRLSLDSATDP
jgi:regulator of protease activity HflC (stomatin/prohibitin superfamily)